MYGFTCLEVCCWHVGQQLEEAWLTWHHQMLLSKVHLDLQHQLTLLCKSDNACDVGRLRCPRIVHFHHTIGNLEKKMIYCNLLGTYSHMKYRQTLIF